jgi:adenylate kinase family enzyme
MKNLDFPISKTKIDGVTERFDLNDPASRKKYFEAKAGPELKKLREYFGSGKTFVAYLMGKKNSGKGTYSKLFMEAIGGGPSTGSGQGNVGHVSVGDIVRDVHAGLSDPTSRKVLTDFLGKNYRGFHTMDEAIAIIEGRSQEKLMSTELIVALLKYEISKRPRQAIFIDGFPRGLDQVSYSMFLKELLGYRSDPDFFVFIDVPDAVVDERIKTRVICPVCKTSRNIRLALTRQVGYDESTKSFYLVCDNVECKGARMAVRQGDELGLAPLRSRLEADDVIFSHLLKLKGVPKIYLRNSVPAAGAKEYVDDYEITPAYSFELDADKKVKVIESPWTVNDDDGIQSYSLMPAPVALSLIKQTAKVLEL